MSSRGVNGRTPLSERLNATRFSYVDCIRSIANCSSCMRGVYFRADSSMREDLLPRMIRIPGGEFFIGSDDGDDDERPVHAVVLDPYFVGAHPVTVEQYAEFTRDAGYDVPSVRDLPLVVTAAHEAAFREL